jgi:hypothetical protein
LKFVNSKRALEEDVMSESSDESPARACDLAWVIDVMVADDWHIQRAFSV